MDHEILYIGCAQLRNRVTARMPAWLRSYARARARNSITSLSLKGKKKGGGLLAERMHQWQQLHEVASAYMQAWQAAAFDAWLGEAMDRGLVPRPTHPPMGPSAALPGAGNSAPVRALAAGLQKSPVDGPMQGPVVRSGLVRWQ